MRSRPSASDPEPCSSSSARRGRIRWRARVRPCSVPRTASSTRSARCRSGAGVSGVQVTGFQGQAPGVDEHVVASGVGHDTQDVGERWPSPTQGSGLGRIGQPRQDLAVSGLAVQRPQVRRERLGQLDRSDAVGGRQVVEAVSGTDLALQQPGPDGAAGRVALGEQRRTAGGQGEGERRGGDATGLRGGDTGDGHVSCSAVHGPARCAPGRRGWPGQGRRWWRRQG